MYFQIKIVFLFFIFGFKNIINSCQDINEIISNFLKKPKNSFSVLKLTKNVFKFSSENKSYVIKVFENQEIGKNEILWTEHANKIGIGSKLFYADSSYNYMITEFVLGETLNYNIVNSSCFIKNIVNKILILHNSKVLFNNKLNLFSKIEEKYKKIKCSGILKNILEKAYKRFKNIEKKLKNINFPLVPCHNDLNWANIFFYKDSITFIDWEDASLANPYYDIAAFFVLNSVLSEYEILFLENYDKKLLNNKFYKYMKLLKELVYFEFAINLLLEIKDENLLNTNAISSIKNFNHYLDLLKKKDNKIDNNLIYKTAISSLFSVELN